MPEPVGSPLWWLDRLWRKLSARRPRIQLLSRYYEGDHPLPLTIEPVRADFTRLLRASRANWTGLIVDAVAERLHVEGFRLPVPPEEMQGDPFEADEDAHAIWQANQLDAEAELVHIEALVCEESYVTVWANPSERYPLITPEHPSQMVVETGRSDRRELAAVLKCWTDDWTGEEWATLYLPDSIHKWKRRGSYGGRWDEREEVMVNPLGQVPVVAFRNRPRLLTGGRSEIADVLDIQDRINKTLFDRLMASETSSFRQRWVTGMEIPTDPETNAPIQPFKPAVERLWMAEDPETRFGEFDSTDLAPYIKSVESDVNAMAAITRTPPHYLLGAMVNVSGDALKAAESGLSSKAASRTRHFGEAWEQVMRLAFRVLDDPRADVLDSQVIWADVETRTEGERVDALTKMKTLGVPNEALWERWGASPQEIARWRQGRVADVLVDQGTNLMALVP